MFKEKIIQKLIDETKNNNFDWHYLDNHLFVNDKTREMLNQENLKFNFSINYKNSYYYNFNNGFFVLVNGLNTNDLPIIYLLIIPSTSGRDTSILNNSTEYQTELLRLSNLISKQFPNVEDFLSDFLS